MSVYGQLSAARLALLKTELQTDPRALGYAGLLTTSDWISLTVLLNFIRDGVTACPAVGVPPAGGVIGGPTGSITGATNATPIVVTTQAAHGLASGDGVVVAGVGGNTAANGTWVITVSDATHFSLNGSAGNAAFTSGGTFQWCVTGIRNQSIRTQDIIGATAVADVDATVNAQTTAIWQALMNDGAVLLTNADGSENNNATTVKKMWTAGSASRKAIVALETRLGGRCEQVLSLSGTGVGQQQLNGLPFNFTNLLDPTDPQAALIGHY